MRKIEEKGGYHAFRLSTPRLVPIALEVPLNIIPMRSLAHLVTSVVAWLDNILWMARSIDNLDPLVPRPLAIVYTVDLHIGTVDIELGHIHCNPRPHKQTLAPLLTARCIIGDLHRPLVVKIWTRLVVLGNKMERLAAVVTQRVLAEPSTVARLVHLPPTAAGLLWKMVVVVVLQRRAPKSCLSIPIQDIRRI